MIFIILHYTLTTISFYFADLNGTELMMGNRKYILLEDGLVGRKLSDHQYLDDLSDTHSNGHATTILRNPHRESGSISGAKLRDRTFIRGGQTGSRTDSMIQKQMITSMTTTQNRWPWGNIEHL